MKLGFFNTSTKTTLTLGALYLFFVIAEACINNTECANDKFCNPATNTCQESEEKKDVGGAIAAIVVPSTVAAILMCLCIYYCCREKNHAKFNSRRSDFDGVAIPLQVSRV